MVQASGACHVILLHHHHQLIVLVQLWIMPLGAASHAPHDIILVVISPSHDFIQPVSSVWCLLVFPVIRLHTLHP